MFQGRGCRAQLGAHRTAQTCPQQHQGSYHHVLVMLGRSHSHGPRPQPLLTATAATGLRGLPGSAAAHAQCTNQQENVNLEPEEHKEQTKQITPNPCP